MAITMLTVILMSFGVIGMLLVCMFRNASKRDADVDNLLDELEADEKTAKNPALKPSKDKLEQWERDGEWWKKS